ncbi:MAG TPA: hypothetical protein VFZ65_21725 [Planctomycetota bacterium]|nr:hypothetical protein [Planctomycetota bacterium]
MKPTTRSPMPDPFWNALVDAETPSAAEMRAEEAELRALEASLQRRQGGVEKMAPMAVERLVARATAKGVRGAWGGPRRMLLAALVVVSVASAAWVAAKLIWPEQQDAPSRLDYAMAVDLATEPNRNDQAHLSALGIIARECGDAVDTLLQLVAQGDSPLANEPQRMLASEAQRIRHDLVDLMTNGPNVPPQVIDMSLTEAASTAINSSLGFDVREQALIRLHDLARSGLTAMWVSPLTTADAISNRQKMIKRLLDDLRP